MILIWQFGIKSAVLNAELPQNSRLHILEVPFELFQFVNLSFYTMTWFAWSKSHK